MNITIILIIITIISICISIYCVKHKINVDTQTKIENIEISRENEKLKRISDSYQNDITKLKATTRELQEMIGDERCNLSALRQEVTNSMQNQKKLSQEAFENYFKVLENKYKEAEEEHEMEVDALQTAYSNLQLKLMREADECRKDLDKIRTSRAAAIEAQRKEKEIIEQSTFYCLKISDNELKDVAVLESIKPRLNNPRILSMLIWQTYYRTPMTNLCNNVIGKTTKIGIYKITNLKTKECYIGQAVDLAERFKQHAKCGLGVDTPAANKLYKAMQEYGIYSFSWEVLEECPREQLNEKEKFYIELYQSVPYGYNIQSGVSKK